MEAFNEDWLEQHNAKMARLRSASAAAGVPVSVERTQASQPVRLNKSPADAGSWPAREAAGERNASPKSKRAHPEQDLHIAAVKFLHIALPPTWRVVHVANGVGRGGKQAKIANGIRRAMGVRTGFPDLEIIGPGRFVVAEAKAGKGKLFEEQEEWRDWFLSIGVPWFVFRTHEELVAGCLDAGVPLRVRA